MQDLKSEFAAHLASIGFELQANRDAILAKLRQRMGEVRFADLMSIIKAPRTASRQEEIYTHFEDLIEGNLLRSLDPGATLESSYHLYRKSASRLVTGARIIELGCWTGGLASFIATRHPKCAVVGVDGEQKIVDACNAHYQVPNLNFQTWNYRWGRPGELEPADVLLCSLGVVHHPLDNSKLLPTARVRGTREYTVQRDHAIGYFSQWRTAAKDGAFFYAVLRLVPFARFLAWNDAAVATGWTPLLERVTHVDVPSEKVALPALLFQASRSEVLPEETVLERWTWFSRRSDVFAHLSGGSALAAFWALTNKVVLATREFRPAGLLTRDEIGLIGSTGYLFTHDAASAFRLLLISERKAKELSAVVTNGSQKAITDDGAFESPGVPRTSPAGASPFFAGARPATWATEISQ